MANTDGMDALMELVGKNLGNKGSKGEYKTMDSDFCFGKEAGENWTDRFLDANLQLHTIKFEDWSDVIPTKRGDIYMQPCVTSTGDLGLAFFLGEMRLLGYITREDGELRKHFLYISTNRDYIVRLYKDGKRVGDICNRSVEELRSVHFPIQGNAFFQHDEIGDLVAEALERENERHAELERKKAFNESMTEEESVAYAESQQDHAYRCANISLDAKHNGCDMVCASLKYYDGEPIMLPDEYRTDLNVFEAAVYDAYPDLKELIAEVEEQNPFITHALYVLCKPGYNGKREVLSKQPGNAITKDDFMNTASWLMPLITKGIDPEKWFDENFPQGASSDEDITEAVNKATA